MQIYVHIERNRSTAPAKRSSVCPFTFGVWASGMELGNDTPALARRCAL